MDSRERVSTPLAPRTPGRPPGFITLARLARLEVVEASA